MYRISAALESHFGPARPTIIRRRLPWAIALLHTWQERTQQRQMLAALDDRMLRDIGLSRADVTRECHKPFWLL